MGPSPVPPAQAPRSHLGPWSSLSLLPTSRCTSSATSATAHPREAPPPLLGPQLVWLWFATLCVLGGY